MTKAPGTSAASETTDAIAQSAIERNGNPMPKFGFSKPDPMARLRNALNGQLQKLEGEAPCGNH